MTGGRTKLVCTIGPATEDRAEELVAAGMDIARLNFSHGTTANRVDTARRVRAAGNGRVALLADLPGPKIRLGTLADDTVTLETGAAFTLRPTDGASGNADGAHVSYPRLAADVRAGDRILLADGAVELRVTSITDEVRTDVVRGGVIRSHAGVSVPSDRVSEPALTAADRAAVPEALALGADYIAQSFVRRAADVIQLRELLGPDGPPIVAKIETRAAIDDFDAICEVASAVMIARGDLGVEL
ncbi:MAG: pyruvate kinase, partial [Chloroflexota bacterium]|nr:pyruvate kinase [Chloroflexota bacterium]